MVSVDLFATWENVRGRVLSVGLPHLLLPRNQQNPTCIQVPRHTPVPPTPPIPPREPVDQKTQIGIGEVSAPQWSVHSSECT